MRGKSYSINHGWTLIELTLTISLIGLILMFAARIPFFSQEFNTYKFEQHLTWALQKAQMAQLYTHQDVTMDIVDDVLVFRLSDSSEYQWDVDMPKHVRFNPQDFPLKLGLDQPSIKLMTESQTLLLEPYYVLKQSQ